MRLLIWPLIAVCPLAGCKSSGGDSRAGALATTTAVVATVPLAPVAEVYHALSGDIRKEKARTLALHAQYDPVYAARIEMLSKRDPVIDARKAFARGDAVLLPYTRKIPLEFDESTLSAEFRELMIAVITDPLDHDEGRWNSETYRRFLKVASSYRIEFNEEMTRLKLRPNQAPEPTTLLVMPRAGARVTPSRVVAHL